MSGLYPGVDIKKQLQKYYCEKISAGIKLGIIGILMVLLFAGKQLMNDDLKESKYLERNAFGGGEKEVELDAVIGDKRVEGVTITVGEHKLLPLEKKELLDTVCDSLPEVIKGYNTTLAHVCMPLHLITEWENTDITISWRSSNYRILKEDGSFGEEKASKQGTEIILTAEIAFDDLQREEDIHVIIFPPEISETDLLREQLSEAVSQKEMQTREQDLLELPDMLQDKKIIWEEKNTISGLFVIGFPVLVNCLAMWGKDQELHEQYKERNRQLRLEYSEFVSKLRLLIGSGMSSRNAFIRLSTDYKKRRAKGGKRQFVYEEVMMMVRKLENGVSETEAYDSFGRRCNVTCYKKLISIIIQNQKKGTDGLLDSLSTEAKSAFEERKQEARKLGEEAGTKLLVPMMMMMGVVLMIIVIPAYFSFGGI